MLAILPGLRSSSALRTSSPKGSRRALLAAGLLVISTAGVAGSAIGAAGGRGANPARPIVGASIPPLAWMIDRLAGDSVERLVMVPAAAEVETYEPTPQQVRALAACSVYFEVGHPLFVLEASYVAPWLDRHPEVRRVRLSPRVAGRPAGGRGEEMDPHAWTSLRALRRALPELAEALAATLPAEAATIRSRAVRLDAELAALDAELAERFARVRGRRFLIHHPALGYFAADYALVQVALEHEGKEPSPLALAKVVGEARAAGARVVLVTRGAPSRGADVVARELDGRVLEIDPLAADWPAGLRAIGAAVSDALYGR